jgi:hypothetical protein
MQHEHVKGDNFSRYVEALYGFMREMREKRDLCLKHSSTTAVHDKGNALQVYRLFESRSDTVTYLRMTAAALPSWEQSWCWGSEGESWSKTQRDIDARMNRHEKLQPILTRGISWNGRPILIHAYKFEPDPVMKLELVMTDHQSQDPDYALDTMVRALQCHERLVPRYITEAKPPYERHEAEFVTIQEHLSRTMPADLYDLCCFPPPPLDRGS